jgi:virginiamycin B lyase
VRKKITYGSFKLPVLLIAFVIAVAALISARQDTQAAGIIEVPARTNPWGLALDAQGHTWVAEPGCDVSPICTKTFPGVIGEYNRANASLIQNFVEPPNFSSPVFLAIDKRGSIWFTETNSNAIGLLVPGKKPAWKQWGVPTRNAIPYDLVLDNNGNIWFSEFGANKIGFFNTATFKFTETPIPTAGSSPYGITRAPNGSIWFAENAIAKIGAFTPTVTGKITIAEYAIPTAHPHLITADAVGNIWYSEGFSGVVGEFIPGKKLAKQFFVARSFCTPKSPCSGIHISGIAVDKAGKIWFDDSLSHHVGYLNPVTGAVKTLLLKSPNAHPHDGLGVDTANNVWFTEVFDSKLGKIPAGTL